MQNNELLMALEHLLEDAIALGIKDSSLSGSAVYAERMIAKYRKKEPIRFIMKRDVNGCAYLARA